MAMCTVDVDGFIIFNIYKPPNSQLIPTSIPVFSGETSTAGIHGDTIS